MSLVDFIMKNSPVNRTWFAKTAFAYLVILLFRFFLQFDIILNFSALPLKIPIMNNVLLSTRLLIFLTRLTQTPSKKDNDCLWLTKNGGNQLSHLVINKLGRRVENLNTITPCIGQVKQTICRINGYTRRSLKYWITSIIRVEIRIQFCNEKTAAVKLLNNVICWISYIYISFRINGNALWKKELTITWTSRSPLC